MPLRVFHSLPTLSIFVRRVTSMMMLTWMGRGVIQVPFAGAQALSYRYCGRLIHVTLARHLFDNDLDDLGPLGSFRGWRLHGLPADVLLGQSGEHSDLLVPIREGAGTAKGQNAAVACTEIAGSLALDNLDELVYLKAYARVGPDVIHLAPLESTVEVDLALMVDKVQGRDVGASIRPHSGQAPH